MHNNNHYHLPSTQRPPIILDRGLPEGGSHLVQTEMSTEYRMKNTTSSIMIHNTHITLQHINQNITYINAKLHVIAQFLEEHFEERTVA